MSAQPADDAALRALSCRYASGLDRRDMDMYLGVFEPAGVFEMYVADDPDHPTRRTAGHDQIADNLRQLDQRFARTMHFVGNTLYDVRGDEATGEVYSVAHHVSAGEAGPVDYVMHIRYDDDYVRGADGEWRIRRRRLVTQWTSTLPVDAPAGGG